MRAGTTDPAFQKMDLKPGSRVRVTLRKADYRDKVFEVDLAPGVTKYEGVKLDPAFGTLVIESEPSGAKVVVGGKEVGLTPYRNERMASGEHLVSLRLELHRSVENEVVQVRDGEETRKVYKLEADYGTVAVDSEPRGAGVVVGGKELGKTPSELKLSPGRYEVGVELDGYRGKRFEVAVVPGSRVAIGAGQARLERKEFSLTVAADPPVSGARIWMDGRDTGRSAPDTLEGLSEGKHTVEVRAGERIGRAEVAGEDGERKTVTIPLEEAPASAVAGSGAIAGRVATAGGGGPVQVTNGLVGHWPLDGNAEDVSGNGNHGTVEGATFTHDRFGLPGGACHFDGRSARVRMPHSPSLDVAGQNLTMACWVRAGPDQYFRAGIVNKTPGSMPDCGYRIWLYENKVVVAVMHAQEGVGVSSPSPANDNQWHHVVGVFENGSLRLFVDGDLVSEDYTSHGFCSNEADLLIGSYWYPYDDGHEGRTWCSLEGEIDDVRIYNRALSAEEVRSLYHLQ